MEGLLRPIKETVRSSFLWPTLRPRQIHVLGIGAPKTGTASLARLFCDYRSVHEAKLIETVDLIRKKEMETIAEEDLRRALRRRDQELRLECEVGHYLVHFCRELVSLFPEAKFICTVRSPQPWLRSFIDQSINLDQHFSEHLTDEEVEAWKRLRGLNCGPPPETYPDPETPLARYGLPSIDGYLAYWASHNRTLLDVIPANRRLFVPTVTLTAAAERIRAFAGADPDGVPEETHANSSHHRHGVLDAIDDAYIQDRIQAHCSRVLDRFADLGVDLGES